MAKRSEMDLDAALAALAREVHDASPAAGPDTRALVMADAALTTLAREAADAAPRPGADLVARVLADAAEVSATKPAANRNPVPQSAKRRGALTGALGARGGLMDLLFGWRAGAIAAMALALAIGTGVGFEMEPGSLPLLDDDAGQSTVTLASLDADLMDVDGL